MDNEKHKLAEERIRYLQKIAATAVWEWSVPDDRLSIPPEGLEAIGLDPGLRIEKLADFEELVHPDDRRRFIDSVEQAKEGCLDFYAEYRLVGKDERIVLIELECRAICNNSGGSDKFVGYARNISSRKSAFEEYERIDFLLNETGKMARIGGWMFNPKTRDVFWSRQTYHLHGVDYNFVPTIKSVFEFYPKEYWRIFQKNFPYIYRRDRTFSMQAPLTTPAGKTHWVQLHARGELNHCGERVVVGTVQDITERRRIEDDLLRNERLYRSLFELSKDGISIADPEGVIIRANHAKAEMLGYENPQELVGVNGVDLIAAEHRYLVGEMMPVALETGGVSNIEVRLERLDGSEFWVDFSAIVLHDRAGNPELFIDIVRDIDQRRRAKEELAIQKAFFENLFENSPLAIVILDNHDRVVDFNKEFGRLFGYSKSEARGRQINDLIVPYDLQDEGWRATEDVANGRQIDFETVRRDKSGRKIEVNVIGKPIFTEENQLAVYGIYQDITERKRAREELQKIARLESIGIMAGGIAHNFKNLLASMALNTGFARQIPEKSGEFLDKIDKAIDAASALATRFQAFSSGGEPVTKVADLSNVIEEAAIIALSGSNVSWKFSHVEDMAHVKIDPRQIDEVLTNIFLNAREAMPRGGMVTIHCSNSKVESEKIANLKPGLYVRTSIADEGTGIPKEYLNRIFDPFFSTKSGGHGLGLSAAQVIIRKHGGAITVESEHGRGSTFNIYLPAAKPDSKKASGKPGRHKRVSARVLFMDDEQDIRETMADMAEILGYEIITARNGAEAIDLFKEAIESGSPFDAVVLDLTVRGGMGGEETLGELRKIDPEVKAIVFSGHSTKPIIANYREYGFVAKMEKPITIDDFGNTLNEVISSK
ncbi:MAG: PAS domain S-box protein [Candidatus Kapaibacterium sp.]